MVMATKMWRWPRFFGVSWFEIAKFGVLGLEILIWFAPTYHEMKSPTPTEKHRIQYERRLYRDLRVPVSVESVAYINGDRPGIVAILRDREVEPLMARVVKMNRREGRITVLRSNLIQVDDKFYKFFRYRQRVVLVASPYEAMLSEVLDIAVTEDKLVKAYQQLN